MPREYACSRCSKACTVKQMREPIGCIHCLCANCGEPDKHYRHMRRAQSLMEGASHPPQFVYSCEKVTTPF